MSTGRLRFRVHAVQRMYERRISQQEVEEVLTDGETIEVYPDDLPSPRRLVLGWAGGRPLHVVVAEDRVDTVTVVITVYEPDRHIWEDGFRRRRVQ
jgi:hypothetical protein